LVLIFGRGREENIGLEKGNRMSSNLKFFEQFNLLTGA
jgi:hypothetical protein